MTMESNRECQRSKAEEWPEPEENTPFGCQPREERTREEHDAQKQKDGCHQTPTSHDVTEKEAGHDESGKGDEGHFRIDVVVAPGAHGSNSGRKPSSHPSSPQVLSAAPSHPAPTAMNAEHSKYPNAMSFEERRMLRF